MLYKQIAPRNVVIAVEAGPSVGIVTTYFPRSTK